MWLALWNFLFVAAGALIAFLDGRLTHDQMGPRAIPWINHGGNWADLIIMTIVCGLISPYTANVPLTSQKTIIIVSVLVTAIAHAFWAMMQTIPGTVVDPNIPLRLPLSGWWHTLYMIWILTLILTFFLECPGAPRFWVCASLTLFIIPAIMQPGWYVYKISEGTGRVGLASWLISAMMFILIWAVGFTRP